MRDQDEKQVENAEEDDDKTTKQVGQAGKSKTGGDTTLIKLIPIERVDPAFNDKELLITQQRLSDFYRQYHAASPQRTLLAEPNARVEERFGFSNNVHANQHQDNTTKSMTTSGNLLVVQGDSNQYASIESLYANHGQDMHNVNWSALKAFGVKANKLAPGLLNKIKGLRNGQYSWCFDQAHTTGVDPSN